jgi:hypothetical protein|tara:strand:+ start:1585 stop:1809 length:225 start_codon:yes stop_codon:yes gene_type:complete
MKINGGITTGNILQIIITLVALAVLWGSNQVKLDYVEEGVKNLRVGKADKDVIEVQLIGITNDISEIKQMIKDL